METPREKDGLLGRVNVRQPPLIEDHQSQSAAGAAELSSKAGRGPAADQGVRPTLYRMAGQRSSRMRCASLSDTYNTPLA